MLLKLYTLVEWTKYSTILWMQGVFRGGCFLLEKCALKRDVQKRSLWPLYYQRASEHKESIKIVLLSTNALVEFPAMKSLFYVSFFP